MQPLSVTICECGHILKSHDRQGCQTRYGKGWCQCDEFNASERDQIYEATYYAIRDNIEANGFAPSVAELCEIVGVSSKATAQRRVEVLVDGGLLERKGPRALRVVSDE